MIRTIRKLFVKGLHDELGIITVDTDNNIKKPDYPYFSFKYTTLRQNSIEAGNKTYYFDKSENENFENDYVENISFNTKIIMSFNAYSNDILECQEVALKAWEWFKHKSKTLFSDNGIKVVTVGNIQDRTAFLVEEYEYRQGFDIEFRVIHSIENRNETIEEWKMEGEIIWY